MAQPPKEKGIIGLALLLKGGTIDSYSHRIKPRTYYDVKKGESGKVMIVPVSN